MAHFVAHFAAGACFASVMALSACGEAPTQSVTRTAADAGYVALRIEQPEERWAREGFVRLETAVHAPSSNASIDQVEIWARLPPDGELVGSRGPHGPTLAYPAGFEIDRVEFRGTGAERRIVDVRGTRIDASGRQHFHTLRKEDTKRGAALFGFEWPRDDTEAAKAAVDALAVRLRETPPAADYAPKQRERYVKRLRQKNACLKCHTYDRAPNATQGEHGLVNRGTDAAGFFSVLAVLNDDVPVEPYGNRDLNLADPYVKVTCPKGGVQRNDAGKPRCADKAVPRGTLDLKGGLEAGDPRAQAVCESRRTLHARLDTLGRELFAAEFAACLEGVEASP